MGKRGSKPVSYSRVTLSVQYTAPPPPPPHYLHLFYKFVSINSHFYTRRNRVRLAILAAQRRPQQLQLKEINFLSHRRQTY
jgi:hypothetical protein